MSEAHPRTGGRILIDQLALNGVDTIYGVPGESFLAALDAIHDAPHGLRFVQCRHEAAAANMAEAAGKMTGRPGIAFVTRGPGATHAAIGVHTAFQDSTPMLLLIGDVGRGDIGREAFQEVDFPAMFAPLAKWAAKVDDARRLPELVARAFSVAMSGRPGPVVLALPEDMLTEEIEVADARPARPARPRAARADLVAARDLLARAERPLLIAGGGSWSVQAAAELRRFAEANELPVAASFRAQDALDNRSPSYVGHLSFGAAPALAAAVADADLLLVVGPRLGDVTTNGYTRPAPPTLQQTLIHVHPDPDELNRIYQADLPVAADPADFLAEAVDWRLEPRWAERAAVLRKAHLAFSEPPPAKTPLDLARVVRRLRAALSDDTAVANGAGNFAIWLHRFWEYRDWRTQLAPTNGAMGYGVPAAVAAALAGRPALAFCGDGDFLMSGQELATAVRFGAPALFVVVDNGQYGTIRMHQERAYPGRVEGTGLCNPDFAALARAYGAGGWTAADDAGFDRALAEALAHDGPALIHLLADPEEIAPGVTVESLRVR
ncbi:MAG: Thiamine pyrophosphate-requiring enzymes [uncultured Sphingomonadaceae bacterium]|uniref:Thiamine pyrophosphate-requiring enzymes n=1 Tax=uncultured Sphingomonadaceae bacterium TaxID=169976 RepID=A0A6J4SKG3_9SPHN|nr:MAG: Thiamine pyrophosphate-requiring enzymes [uncultured Sphingomonadaceae bacterium]